MYTPNFFAYVVMLLWIPLGLIAVRRWGPQRGVLAALVGGTLALPVRLSFDPPLLMELDKAAFAALAAYLGWLSVRSSAPERNHRSKAAMVFLIFLALSTTLTALTNTDPITAGPRRLPALGFDYAVAVAINAIITMGVPYYLGHVLFRTERDLRLLLTALIVAATTYAFLALIEVRFSPILHRSIYGFFQHDWAQMKREGGFRAILFLAHGLAVALFLAQGLMLCAASFRLKRPLLKAKWVVLVVLVALIGCKSLGAMLIAFLAIPLILYTTPTMQIAASRWLAIAILTYPMLRVADWVPLDDIHAIAFDFDPARAQSLKFRLDQEVGLLEHARERLLFGWGAWGRNRLYDDAGGEDVSVVDGFWIKSLGTGGLLWYAIMFGFLLFPVLRAKAAAARMVPGSDEQKLLSGAAVVLAFGAVDLLPNSMFHPLPFLLAGALQGYELSIAQGRGRAGQPA